MHNSWTQKLFAGAVTVLNTCLVPAQALTVCSRSLKARTFPPKSSIPGKERILNRVLWEIDTETSSSKYENSIKEDLYLESFLFCIEASWGKQKGILTRCRLHFRWCRIWCRSLSQKDAQSLKWTELMFNPVGFLSRNPTEIARKFHYCVWTMMQYGLVPKEFTKGYFRLTKTCHIETVCIEDLNTPERHFKGAHFDISVQGFLLDINRKEQWICYREQTFKNCNTLFRFFSKIYVFLALETFQFLFRRKVSTSIFNDWYCKSWCSLSNCPICAGNIQGRCWQCGKQSFNKVFGWETPINGKEI